LRNSLQGNQGEYIFFTKLSPSTASLQLSKGVFFSVFYGKIFFDEFCEKHVSKRGGKLFFAPEVLNLSNLIKLHRTTYLPEGSLGVLCRSII